MAFYPNLFAVAKHSTILLFFCISNFLFAQDENKITPKLNDFTASVTVQNKGISTIPNLTLGKPAVLFNLKMGRKLTFEPEFRFALETGNPWAMVFWWRYYGTVSDKFKITYHTNYSLSFKSIDAYNSSGTPQEIIRTTRYLAAAVEPNYKINKYMGVSSYLFYTRGLESFITKNTYMVSIRPVFSNIPLFKDVTARIVPEVYYLKMDENDGVYLNSRFGINKKNCRFSLSGLINKPLKSNIPSEYDFLWNVGLSYTFNKRYIEA